MARAYRSNWTTRKYWEDLENDKDFKKLRDKWYKKIEDKGFKDVELKGSAYLSPSSVQRSHKRGEETQKFRMYELAMDWYWQMENSGGWDDYKPYEKEIWFLYGMGRSYTQIHEELDLPTISTVKNTIHMLRQRFMKDMKIRKKRNGKK